MKSEAVAHAQRRTVTFGGHVQGVGFRYTTSSIASTFRVTGFVRNLSDGRVELVVEGDANEIDAFLAKVRDRMNHFIRDVNTHESAATGEFAAFAVRH